MLALRDTIHADRPAGIRCRRAVLMEITGVNDGGSDPRTSQAVAAPARLARLTQASLVVADEAAAASTRQAALRAPRPARMDARCDHRVGRGHADHGHGRHGADARGARRSSHAPAER